MQPRHRVSRTAIELIKRFEGYREKAAQLPDGRWTIGHGHTLTARQGAVVSAEDAEALLLYDLIAVAHALNEQVFSPLGQNQFDALASFAFNLGLDQFGRSGVLKRLNEGSPILAASAMELWRKSEVGGERIVVDALVRRRAAEKALFLTPDDQTWTPAPSHVLKPLVDTDAFDLIPMQDPAHVSLSLEGEAVVVTREGDAAPGPVAPDEDAFGDDDGPARSAAEAVTARLSTIFQDPGEEPRIPPPPEPPAEPDFVLQPPEFDEDELVAAAEPDDDADELRGPDLFETPLVTEESGDAEPDEPEYAEAEIAPAEAEDAVPEAAGLEAAEPEAPEPEEIELETEDREATVAEPAAADTDEFGFPLDDDDRPPIPERRVIDDRVPYELDDEPVVHARPEQPEGSALAVVMLGALGLVFFGGGAFWAFYARPMPSTAWLDPRMVGLFAGVAGALFIAVAVYLLLQRLGRAQERAARERG